MTGGIDCNGSWPGLIRIKRLFPHQPASACGLLNVGDLLLEANGITLTGLTNYVSAPTQNHFASNPNQFSYVINCANANVGGFRSITDRT